MNAGLVARLRYEVQQSGPATGCWFWTGATTSGGYGRATVDGKFWRAHRLAYTALVGEIPPGRVVRHACGFRSCVNPVHLKIGTQRANVWDAIEAGSHCHPEGYAMTPRVRPEEVDE